MAFLFPNILRYSKIGFSRTSCVQQERVSGYIRRLGEPGCGSNPRPHGRFLLALCVVVLVFFLFSVVFDCFFLWLFLSLVLFLNRSSISLVPAGISRSKRWEGRQEASTQAGSQGIRQRRTPSHTQASRLAGRGSIFAFFFPENISLQQDRVDISQWWTSG